jgi:hypothetical protein
MSFAGVRTTTTPSKEEAFAIYKQAINALEIWAEHSSHLSNDSEYSNDLRCHLLNRPPGSNVSWDDVVFARLQYDFPDFHNVARGKGKLSSSTIKSPRKLKIEKLKGEVLVLIGNLCSADQIFYDEVPNMVVLALHGMDKNGKPMRIESDTSSDSSNRELDFEERLGVMEDAISIRVKKNQAGLGKACYKVTAMDATKCRTIKSFQDFFRKKCATRAQNNLHQQPSEGSPLAGAPPLSRISQKDYLKATAGFAEDLRQLTSAFP